MQTPNLNSRNPLEIKSSQELFDISVDKQKLEPLLNILESAGPLFKYETVEGTIVENKGGMYFSSDKNAWKQKESDTYLGKVNEKLLNTPNEQRIYVWVISKKGQGILVSRTDHIPSMEEKEMIVLNMAICHFFDIMDIRTVSELDEFITLHSL